MRISDWSSDVCSSDLSFFLGRRYCMTIELYSWATPNGHQVHIMLEELGLKYNVHPVHIGAGDQFTPDFLHNSPHNKMPEIDDPEGPDDQQHQLLAPGAILPPLSPQKGPFYSHHTP